MAGTWTISSYGNWKEYYASENPPAPPTTNLLDLCVTDFKIKFCNRAADEARIQFEREEPLLDPHDIWSGFCLGYTYRLSCDDTPLFSGRLEEVNPVGNGGSHKLEFVFKGGWHVLESAMYKAYLGNHSNLWTTHCSIGKSWVDQEIQDVISCAGSYNGSFIHVPRANWGNYVSVSRYEKVRYTEFFDLTCAEVLNKILAYYPASFVWSAFDIEKNSNVPILNAKMYGANDSDSTYTDILSSGNVESFDISAPMSRRIPGVGVLLEHIFSPRETAFASDLGALLATIVQEDADFLEDETDVDIYAISLYNANRCGYPDGTVVLAGKNPPYLHTLRPCRFLSLDLNWFHESHDPSPIQSVEFDIGRGRTTISFGPPSHLGSQDLVSLALANPSRSS